MEGRSLSEIRRDYASRQLTRADLAPVPWEQLERWLADAAGVDPEDYNAMHLATVGVGGMPSGRIVLARGVGPEGVTFYTTYASMKGRELHEVPRAAVTFFWRELERQVRIQGEVVRVSAEESDRYFASRPRESQIGAWASAQSEVVPAGEDLRVRFEAMADRFKDAATVPRPAEWGGFRIRFDVMECWQGRPSRLHDRWRYERSGPGWEVNQLFP